MDYVRNLETYRAQYRSDLIDRCVTAWTDPGFWLNGLIARIQAHHGISVEDWRELTIDEKTQRSEEYHRALRRRRRKSA